jgi:hypothetical protein
VLGIPCLVVSVLLMYSTLRKDGYLHDFPLFPKLGWYVELGNPETAPPLYTPALSIVGKGYKGFSL